MSNTTQAIQLTAKDVSKVEKENMFLNERQLKTLLKKTPAQYVRERKMPGGKVAKYIPTGYVTKVLNILFGFDWDFSIEGERIEGNMVIVKGRLSVRSNGKVISKMQYGRQTILYLKAKPDQPVDLGNTFKGAASDAFKKCASLLGVAADIYSPNEFTEVDIVETEVAELTDDETTAKEVILGCQTLEELEELSDSFKASDAMKNIYNAHFVELYKTEKNGK